MYNFRMTKAKSDEIIQNCNFNDFERSLFESLILSKTRKDVYEMFDISESTINRAIAKIAKTIDNYENNKDLNSLKLYKHIFPNNKKDVGVCQCCEDRWGKGNGRKRAH